MLLNKIAQVLNAQMSDEQNQITDIDIKNLLTDSRNLNTEPKQTLFFGLRTKKDDGANYITGLIKKGVEAFVINKSSFPIIAQDLKTINGKNYCILLVEDSLTALQQLAIYKRNHFKGTVIGITGSNGKTALKEMLYDILKDDYNVIRSPKSYNSQIGVPLSVWQLPEQSNPSTDIAIFEVGISRPGEMDKLVPVVQPTIGILTNIGTEHEENFPSLEDKIKEKRKLFENCPVVIEDEYHQSVRICEEVMRALGYNNDLINKRIATKTHETKLYINLTALVDNVRYFRSFLAPSTQLVCMVKAFAYGVGSSQISKVLQQATFDNKPMVQYLAVAIADEGIELRKAGIKLPIIVMNPEKSAIKQIIENNLQPNIYSFDIIRAFQECISQMGLFDYPVHIKIDSGMHRLGFRLEDLPTLIGDLHKLYDKRCLFKVYSVFSHLACAEDKTADAFTEKQFAYFNQAYKMFADSFNYPIRKHICNSAGIERFANQAQDMCRLGIGMYGFSAIDAKLQNVCSLKTTIISVKNIDKDEYIGYNCKTQLRRNSKIAVIPIGYADGLDRRLSDRGCVIVRNTRCPIVGNICMDQTMIDITATDAMVGDMVTVFGDELPLSELCEKLHTIPYEILTSISHRVTRDYFYD